MPGVPCAEESVLAPIDFHHGRAPLDASHSIEAISTRLKSSERGKSLLEI